MNGKGDKARNNFSKDWYNNYEQINWGTKKENCKNHTEIPKESSGSKMRGQLKEDINSGLSEEEAGDENIPLTD